MELRDFTLPVTVETRKCSICPNRVCKVCKDGGRAADCGAVAALFRIKRSI